MTGCGEGFKEFGFGAHAFIRGKAGDGFNPTDAGRDGVLANNAEEADLAGVADVRARTEFHRPAVERRGLTADLYDADGFAILVAEELHDIRATLDGSIGYFPPGYRLVGEDALVDEALNVGKLTRRECLAIEVEGKLGRVDGGALLRGVGGDDFMQRPVENVRNRMVALDGVAAGLVDRDFDDCTGFGGIVALDEVEPGLARLLSIGDAPRAAAERDDGGVADLTAHLGVTGRLLEDDGVAFLNLGDLGDFGLRAQGVVAGEGRGVIGADVGEGNDFLLLGGPGPGPLFFHQLLEASDVDGESTFAGHQLREVEREALLIIQAEGEGASDGASSLELGRLVLEERDALIERTVKRFFFVANDFRDNRAARADFGEDVAHGVGKNVHQFVEEAMAKAEGTAVTHRAAQDTAEDIVAIRVPWLNTVRNGER